MSKKNLPNIPIYIGDWERDCNVLSLESEMAWLKIIFKMHLLGKQSVYKTSTKGLQILWKTSTEKVLEIIEELRFNEICEIADITGGYEFLSRRLKKENELSKIRSEAVNSRYETDDKPIKKKKAFYKQPTKPLQNTDNDIDYDNEIENEIEKGKEGMGEKPKFKLEDVVKIFNSVCHMLPNVSKLTPQRTASLKNRIQEVGLEGLGNVFQKVSESRFLNGESERGWKADFDWILKPANFIKISEGKYDNANGTGKQITGNAGYRASSDLQQKIADRLQSG